MLLIGTTKKLQKEIPYEIDSYEDYNVKPINQWIANLYKVSRYKGVIFMNVETRYCVSLFRLRKKEFNNLNTLFINQLKANLKEDGLLDQVINQYLDNFNDVKITNTFSRSILGSIKENIYFSEIMFAKELGIENPNMQYLNKYLNNDMIHLPLGPISPAKLMKENLEKQYK